MPAPVLISNKGAEASPNRYQIPTNLAFVPTAITALFDGGGAGQDFLACLTFYSQDGLIMARQFPAASIKDGESFEVTFAPFLDRGAAGSGDGVSFAGVLGTGVNLVAPYDEDIPFDGTFQTNDPGTFFLASGIEMQLGRPGTYCVAAMIAGWDSSFINTRFYLTLNINGGNNPVLKNSRVIQPQILNGDVVQIFDIFQYNGGLGLALTLHGVSATEDFVNANADHSLVVWRMGEYLGWTGFD